MTKKVNYRELCETYESMIDSKNKELELKSTIITKLNKEVNYLLSLSVDRLMEIRDCREKILNLRIFSAFWLVLVFALLIALIIK